MINLLPPQEKQELLQEEKYRLVLILCCLVLIFLISLSLILLSLKIHISGQSDSQRILVRATEKQFQSSQMQKLETEINLINKNLAKLDSFYQNQVSFAGVLEKISEIIPEGMYLTSLALNKKEVSLGGFSPSREILFEFKKRLEQESAFEEVYFPPASWVTPKDFTATFKLKI